MSEQAQEPQPPAVAEQAPPPAPPVKMKKPIEARVYELVGGLVKARCDDDESLQACIDYDKMFAEAAKRVDDVHKERTAGITESKRAIDAERKELADTIKAAREYIQKELIAPFRERQRAEAEAEAARQRAEAEDRALTEAERLESEGKADEAAEVLAEGGELAEGIGTTERTGPVRGALAGTASFTEVWDFEIEDEAQVPREYCRPDPKLIREAVRRKDNPAREIAGVRIFKTERMTNR